jgi:hypothetical protein
MGYILGQNGWNVDTTGGGGPADWGLEDHLDSRPEPTITYSLMPVRYRMEYPLFAGPGASEPKRIMEAAQDALLINAGEWAAEWYAERYAERNDGYLNMTDPYWWGGIGASLWTPSTAGKTALTLSVAYAARVYGPFNPRGTPKLLQHGRKYFRFDRPHHGKGWEFDGTIPKAIRKIFQ